MALDEYIYGKVSNYFKNNKKQSVELLERTVFLDDIKENITILARAISGNSIDIFHAEREGGYKNNSFFLPKSIAFFDSKTENKNFYSFRILYLCLQQKLNLNWQENADTSLLISQQNALETSPIILQELFKEYPITLSVMSASSLGDNSIKSKTLSNLFIVLTTILIPFIY